MTQNIVAVSRVLAMFRIKLLELFIFCSNLEGFVLVN